MLLALWCAASWKLSSQSDPERYVGVHIGLPDKVEHGIEYAVGGFLAAGTFRRSLRRPMFVAAVGFCGLWGVADEFHQSYVPDRDGDAVDVVADVTGACIGAAAFVLSFRQRQRTPAGDDESPGRA